MCYSCVLIFLNSTIIISKGNGVHRDIKGNAQTTLFIQIAEASLTRWSSKMKWISQRCIQVTTLGTPFKTDMRTLNSQFAHLKRLFYLIFLIIIATNQLQWFIIACFHFKRAGLLSVNDLNCQRDVGHVILLYDRFMIQFLRSQSYSESFKDNLCCS